MKQNRITKEVIDKSGEYRISQKSTNGNITYASTEGYKNRKDLRKNAIDSSIALLDFYADDMSIDQLYDVNELTLKTTPRLISEIERAIKNSPNDGE